MIRSRIKQTLPPTLLGLGLTLILAWGQFADLPLLNSLQQRMESLAYDLRLNATLDDQHAADQRIIIIDIDERSLTIEGHWPWARDKIATLTDKLFDAGAIVVGYDIFFSEAERNAAETVLQRLERDEQHSELSAPLSALLADFDNDSRLAASLSERDTTLGYLFHAEDSIPIGSLPPPLVELNPEAARHLAVKRMPNFTANLPQLQAAAANSGFVTTWPDADGIIRRTPMLLRHGDQLYGSLSLQIAKLYLFLDEIELNTKRIGELDMLESITLGSTTIPSDGVGFTLVPYRGPSGQFQYISATDILNDRIEPETLENAIVLVGATAVGIADLVATPVENIYPGVEVHATMVRAILDNQFPSEPAWADGANLIASLGVGLILALLLPHLSPLWLVAISLAVAGGIAWGNFWFWHEKGLSLALAWPLLIIVLLSSLNMSYGFLREHRKRSQLKNIFGQYIPPQLVDQMSEDAREYGFEGESREMTVLFADIRGFTTLSEKLSPAELRALLNRYFTHMTEIIFDNRGTIDKYVGDMIMAFWGAPLRDPDHAKHAIEAAMAMLEKTAELKPILMAEGYPEVDIGIGLNTGLMNVGDMGSSYRRAYTVLGDNVNLGSRIEGLTKFYGARLVVGETTREGQDDFVFRRLDLVKVKGKTEGVTVYEPQCRAEEATPELLAELEEHERGLAAYYAQDWREALRIFGALKQQQPEARIYQLYLERISELEQDPPGADWDGVYVRTEK